MGKTEDYVALMVSNFGEAFVWNENNEKGLRDIKKDGFEAVGPICHNAMFTETQICTGGHDEKMD